MGFGVNLFNNITICCTSQTFFFNHKDKLLNTLNKKVAEVYKVCVEETEVTSLSTFQMLKVIEIRVSQLCEMLEAIPDEYLDVIEATEKLRLKERRQR